MANIKSAKKRARQTIKRHEVNVARRSDIKTAIKKVMTAIDKKDIEAARQLLKDAEAKLARAKGKGTIHRKAASRKISRLVKRVNAVAA
jgi:small subunit ribosomal protein S20